MSAWDKLSMSEKADVMKLALEGGVYDLDSIREGYNKFAEGGSKEESHLSYGYPVYWSDEVPSKYNWAKSYLKEHPDVTGFAVGGGAQGPEDIGQRVIIRNSHSNIIPDHNDTRWYGLDKIEAIRHYMDETGYTPNFKTSPEQDKFRRDNFSNEDQYGRNDTAWKQSVISRITADKETDKEFGVTPEQFRDYANIMRGLNSKMDNHYGIPNEYRGGYYLPEVTISGNKHSIRGPLVESVMNEYKSGGSIYIKPSHRERLTELKKRTGKTEAELYRTGGPAVRKMITFARSARKWKHGLGGNLFREGGNDGSPNIFRYDDGRYVYQESPTSEEITVTPFNTVFSDPSQWTYTDANGKLYTPRNTQQSYQGEINQGEAGYSISKAIDDYLKEAAYRAKDGTLALQGKYTMPAIAAASVLPLAGEAFAGTSIAGIPAATWADTALTAGFGAHGLNHTINEGIDGWGDAAMTAFEVTPLGRAAKPMWNVGKEGLQYTTKAIDNTARYMSPSYDLYRTIGETPIPKGSLQKSLVEDFGVFKGPSRSAFFDTPYRERIEGLTTIKEPAEIPEQYGWRMGDYGLPETLGKDGKWHIYPRTVRGKLRDPIDHSIWVGRESVYQPTDYLYHFDNGNYPVYYDTNGNSVLSRVPDATGNPGPIWWNKNSQWDINNVNNVHDRIIKVPDYGGYRQEASYYQKSDPNAILTGDYPLKDAEFLERDNTVGTMRRGVFAQQPAPKTVEAPTIGYADAAKQINLPEVTGKKHRFGGNLFDGEEEGSQQMFVREKNNNPIAFDAEGNLTDQVTGDKGTMNLPEITISPSRYRSAFEGNSDLAPELLKFTPVLGDALDAADVVKDAYNGDYLNASIGAGLFMLPNFIEKPIKAIGKGAYKLLTATTREGVERGRNQLLNWIKSPFYKERLLDEPLYRVSDNIISDISTSVKKAPINIKERSTLEDFANGVTAPRPPKEYTLPDGTRITDYNTGLDVAIASDLGKDADATASHELLHYMTANSKGTPVQKGTERIIENGWFAPTETHFDLIGRTIKRRGKGWQNYIIDQNNSLLPEYDSIVKMVMEKPDEAKMLLIKAGRTPEQAEEGVKKLRNRYSYWYDIQEQRAHLLELFLHKIKPNLKNPNNAEEIEDFLAKHPDLLGNSSPYQYIQEIRPGSLKQYAKYFASALGTLPFIAKSENNE